MYTTKEHRLIVKHTSGDKLIEDAQSLEGAKSRFGSDIKVWDDGFGDLYIHRDSMGINGIVRANSWHEAYECVLDEILTPISVEDAKELFDEMGSEEADLPEGYQYQSNSTGTGIVYTDLNGDYLDKLNKELLDELEIELIIKEED